MRNRTEQLQELGKTFLRDRFRSQMEWLRKHEEELCDSFSQKCCGLFSKAYKLQKTGALEPASVLGISPLSSSLLTKSYEIQIILYNGLFYFDNASLSDYWPASSIFRSLDEDLKDFHVFAQGRIHQVKGYEIQDYRQEYVKNHLKLLNSLMAKSVMRLCAHDTFRQLQKTDDFKILYGEHMMPMLQLYPVEETR